MKALLIVLSLLFVTAAPAATDPVAELQQRINAGRSNLVFEKDHGYLVSLLKALKVPVSSQTLVFSKTSLQSERISPSTPRAIYFNDDVYVAWVQGAPVIEIMSVDPSKGAVFYMLGQDKGDRPVFERSTGHECSVCHYVQEAAPKFVPRLMLTSVIPDSTGDVAGTFPIETTDRSPMKERWGGWYVTGTHGSQTHAGNIAGARPASVPAALSAAALAGASNIKDLTRRFNTAPYLSPYSDIVALMTLGHQTTVQNLIALANSRGAGAARETGESLVRAMLFEGAPPLTSPISGTSTFATDFQNEGPKDGRGRSLRDFDLQTRLFRYPLSYLIYSKPFDALDPAVKTVVYRRLREILSGADKSRDFAYLSATDRAAILEILRATKPDFPH
ncbi:MAG TPA: hypothetical protein VFY29_02325 [Terriglobia bacterium]|nr:hypothetical protein [Terriglobia bacterium]